MTRLKFFSHLGAVGMLMLGGWVSTVHSHPGHEVLSADPSSIAHYAFEPHHLLPALGAAFWLYVAVRWSYRARLRSVAER